MNQRERTLAIVVGALLFLAVGVYAWGWVATKFRQRNSSLANLNQQVETKEQIERDGQRAKQRIRDYEVRSLPANLDVARSLYKDWLMDELLDIGFTDPMVDPVSRASKGEVYTELAFRLGGEANLEQVTELLYRFYSANHLHRIGQFVLRPARDSKNGLTVTMTVQALVLPGAEERDALNTDHSERLARDGLEDYTDVIVHRNMFSAANEPPRFARIGSQEAVLGETFRYRVRADDPEQNRLTYRLADGAPKGAEIDERSGEIRWRPDELGRFDFEVMVSDDGLPSKDDKTTFTVAVVEPQPEPEPDYEEDAKFTEITGITHGQRRFVWISHRLSGKSFRLEEGASFRAGQLEGRVGKINSRNAELVVGDRTLVVAVGQKISEGTELSNEPL